MYFTNRWACGSEKIKKGRGKTHFAKSVGAALIIAAASLAAFTGCPQDGNGIELPADPIAIIRDGISFRTQGEFTRAEAAAIEAIINNLNLSAFQGLVSGLTIMADGALSITLTEGNKAVIYTSDATVEGIVAALTAGRNQAYAAQNPENGNGNDNGDNGQDPNDVIVTTPTPVDNEGINFIIRAGLTQGQVTALTALINGLDVGDYAGYVETVRLNQGVEGGHIIDPIIRDGVNATSVIYIDYDATIEEIMNVLAAAKVKVQAIREAALDTEFWTTIEPNPTNFTHGGVDFSIAGNLLTRGEILDITEMVGRTTLTEFAGFITSVEFARNVPDGLRIVRGDGEQATASITIEHDADQDALEDAFNEALAEVIAEREYARLAREAEEERIAAEAAFRAANPIVDGPLEIEGITFTLAGAAGFDTRNSADMAIVSGVTATLADLGDLSAFGSITGVTFGDVVDTTAGFDYDLEGDAPDVTVTITVPFGATAQQVQAALTAAQAIADEYNTIDTGPVMEYVTTMLNPFPDSPDIHTDIRVYVEQGGNFTIDEVRELVNGIGAIARETASGNFSTIRFMSDVPDAFDNGTHATARGIRVVLKDGEHFGTIYLDRTSGWTLNQDLNRGGVYIEQLRAAAQAQAAIVISAMGRDSR